MAKLLIVDDDIRLRKLVRTYGEVEHYECEEAADGLSALEKLQDSDFDLVILVVMMPGLDGFETLERTETKRDPGHHADRPERGI